MELVTHKHGAAYSASRDWNLKIGIADTSLKLSLEDFPRWWWGGGGGEKLEIKLQLTFSWGFRLLN